MDFGVHVHEGVGGVEIGGPAGAEDEAVEGLAELGESEGGAGFEDRRERGARGGGPGNGAHAGEEGEGVEEEASRSRGADKGRP